MPNVANKSKIMVMVTATSTRTFRVCQAGNFDVAEKLSRGISDELWELILKFRFLSPTSFLSEVCDTNECLAFLVCTDVDDELIGWACCFRFHERPGYVGAAQFVIDTSNPTLLSVCGRDLYYACEQESRRRGIHTFISFFHSNMQSLRHWYNDNGFAICGSIDLNTGEKLYLCCKKIA